MTDLSYNTDWVTMNDQTISNAIGSFIKHHRLNQNRSQKEVASAANISRSTLSLLEHGKTVTLKTLIQVLRILDLLYVMNSFQAYTQISPIELAKLEQKKRKRASSNTSINKTESNW